MSTSSPGPHRRRWKWRLGMFALATLLTLVLLELIATPLLLLRQDHARMLALPEPLRPLGQTSKQGVRPHDYILMLGDSYVEGHGEWLDGVDKRSGAAFHSAHVLHERTGVDVLSYGKGGVGNLKGFVIMPIRHDRALARFRIERPRVVLACVYEGNDFNNNLRRLREDYPDALDWNAPIDELQFDAFLHDTVVTEAQREGLEDLLHPYMLAYLDGRLESLLEQDDDDDDHDDPDAPAPPVVNRARIRGQLQELANELQSPALELTDAELDLALRVTERTLAFAAARYADADFCVVYIPSPLACYELASDEVDIQTYEQRGSRYPAAFVRQRSDALAGRLEAFARQQGFDFLDLRPALRAAAAEQVIHGKGDWKHFDRTGYTVMGEALAESLAPDLPGADGAR